jgi:hypothetical protein
LKKPATYRDLTDPASPPSTGSEAIERLHKSMEEAKGDMVVDPEFAANLLRKVLDNPDVFVREQKGETSGSIRKIERHTLRGRTNKVKALIYLSDAELEQLESYIKLRGDRGPSDILNQLLCTALGSLRSL